MSGITGIALQIAVGITIFCKENCGTANTEEPGLEIDKAVIKDEFLILKDTADARTFGIITLLFADTYCFVTLISRTDKNNRSRCAAWQR